MLILDGKAVAAKVLAEVKAGVAALARSTGAPPTLAVVLVGEDPASQVYVRNKKRSAEEVGIASRDYLYPRGCTQAELLATIAAINADRVIHGILLQLPLPKGLDEDEALAAIAPEKDVDGLHPDEPRQPPRGQADGGAVHAGRAVSRSSTTTASRIEGAEAVVVGRSRLVGKPLAQLLLGRHATVTMCHTRTRDLAAHCRRADILCVAAGRPRFVTGDMVKDGAVVIDVGVNRLDTGKLAGDVDFASVSPKVARHHARPRRRRPHDHRHADAQHAPRRQPPARPTPPALLMTPGHALEGRPLAMRERTVCTVSELTARHQGPPRGGISHRVGGGRDQQSAHALAPATPTSR